MIINLWIKIDFVSLSSNTKTQIRIKTIIALVQRNVIAKRDFFLIGVVLIIRLFLTILGISDKRGIFSWIMEIPSRQAEFGFYVIIKNV